MPKQKPDVNPVLPKDYMIRKVPNKNAVMTTAFRLQTTAAELPPISMRAEEDVMRSVTFVNTSAAAVGGLPSIPDVLHLDPTFTPAIGVYLVGGGAGQGKSVLTAALVAWANDKEVPASYISTFEPRAPNMTHGTRQVFKDPKKFAADLRAILSDSSRQKLIVADSVTLPMKANAAQFDNQATFTGGMQPSDRGFLDNMSEIARDKKACLILTINSTLVPYMEGLAGAVEGIINVTDVGHFMVTDRTAMSARRGIAITIPSIYVSGALRAFGFGEYKNTGGRKFSRRIVGL